MPYRHAPGTIWRRALRRVERRVAPLLATRHALPEDWQRCSAEYALLREASDLANRLAYCAGIVGPMALGYRKPKRVAA